jgi:DNA-binding XRE family transcriptional regulator
MEGDMTLEEFLAEELKDPGFAAEWAVQEPFRHLPLNVWSLRETSAMTQQQLADAAKMKQPRIAEIERGDGNPTLLTISRIAFAGRDGGPPAHRAGRGAARQGARGERSGAEPGLQGPTRRQSPGRAGAGAAAGFPAPCPLRRRGDDAPTRGPVESRRCDLQKVREAGWFAVRPASRTYALTRSSA